MTPDTNTEMDWAALSEYLGLQGLELRLDPLPKRFKGGLANLNYLIHVNGIPTVFRRPPDGDLPPGAHDMAREHKILSRLSNGFELAPNSKLFCEDVSIIGVPFQLIEFREGLIVRGNRLGELEGDKNAAQRLSEILVETLARVHTVSMDSIGLGDLGRPEGFLERGVAGWSKRARLVESTDQVRLLNSEIITWLAQHIKKVPQRPATLLHCDIKLDNIILDKDNLSPKALIDWDMGTRGDPLFDLATTLSYWTEPGDPECMHRLGQMPTAQAGFMTRERVAQRYGEITGINLSGLSVVRVLALFKLSVVFLQLHQRWRDGALKGDEYAGFQTLGTELLLLSRDVATDRQF